MTIDLMNYDSGSIDRITQEIKATILASYKDGIKKDILAENWLKIKYTALETFVDTLSKYRTNVEEFMEARMKEHGYKNAFNRNNLSQLIRREGNIRQFQQLAPFLVSDEPQFYLLHKGARLCYNGDIC